MGLLQRTEKALQFSCVRIISFFFSDSSYVNNVVPQFLVNRFDKTCLERSVLIHVLLSVTVSNPPCKIHFEKNGIVSLTNDTRSFNQKRPRVNTCYVFKFAFHCALVHKFQLFKITSIVF